MLRSVARILYLLLCSLVASSSPAGAQIQLSPVASGLSRPVFVTHAGDGSGRLFIVEQQGIIRVLAPGNPQPTVFLDITAKTDVDGERGLLGLAFHPSYPINGRFFVFYTRASGDLSLNGDLIIAEYRANPPSSNVASTAETILLTIEHSSQSNHNGGMIAFEPGASIPYLYIGVGDGGGGNDPQNNAQNINNLLGKILRIRVNDSIGPGYSIPPDNPFVGLDGADEIFAYGMRNPWRFSFDRQTGQLWVGDVGQGAREEVDTPIVKGGNYGWRVFEGNLCTNLDAAACGRPQDYIFPAFEYAHVNGRCSLTGGYVYRGIEQTLPAGTYIYGDYCSGEILAWNGSAQSVVLDSAFRISSFGEDGSGELYVADITNGTVYRIDNTTPPPPPCTYTISPTEASYGRSGGSGSVTITAAAGCAWTAASNASWITVTSGASGSGNGTVTYSVASIKPKRRTGTVTIAGQTFTVNQTK